MQEERLVGRARRRFIKCATDSNHGLPVATNLLDRRFEAAAPNQAWGGDTTEPLITNGKLYLAAIVDLNSRSVVSWALSAVNDRHLTIKALDVALRRRCPQIGLMHHSDQGSTLQRLRCGCSSPASNRVQRRPVQIEPHGKHTRELLRRRANRKSRKFRGRPTGIEPGNPRSHSLD